MYNNKITEQYNYFPTIIMSTVHLEWQDTEGSFSLVTNSRDQMAKLRQKSWPTMREKILRILEVLKEEDINLPLFLDAFSWGKEDCIDDHPPSKNTADDKRRASCHLRTLVEASAYAK